MSIIISTPLRLIKRIRCVTGGMNVSNRKLAKLFHPTQLKRSNGNTARSLHNMALAAAPTKNWHPAILLLLKKEQNALNVDKAKDRSGR